MAETALVSSRAGDGDKHNNPNMPFRLLLRLAPSTEPELDVRHDGNKPRAKYELIPHMTSIHLASVVGLESPSARATLDLVKRYAWSSRMTGSRHSQWRAWLAYCVDSALSPLPVTEAHVLGFFGWLLTERLAGRHYISSTSVSQYLSAVRQMHELLTKSPLADFSFVGVVQRAYGN